MPAIVIRVCIPGVQLRARLAGVNAGKSQIREIAGNFLGQFTHSFIDPSLFVAIIVPVNHVLKFMGQYSLVQLKVIELKQPVQADCKHLFLVGKRIGERAEGVGAAEVTGDSPSQTRGMENV